MLKEERQKMIVDLVNQQNAVTVDELCDTLKVSQPTISRDLQILDQAGKITKTHGGAVSVSIGIATEPSFVFRKSQFSEEKQKIAKKATDYIKPGETIIFDSGTTVFWMTKYLHNINNLNIWTNDFHIAMELIEYEGIDIVFLGGKIRKKYFNTIGVFTNHTLDNIHVDRLFIGVDAIDVDGGLMVYSPDEAELKRKMIKAAKEVIVACDHSKFKKKALISICPVEAVNRIITTKEVEERKIDDIRKLGIKVNLV